jgi:hypothetical protein
LKLKVNDNVHPLNMLSHLGLLLADEAALKSLFLLDKPLAALGLEEYEPIIK